jgi:hypothetical protein
MTRNRDISDRWSAARSPKPGQVGWRSPKGGARPKPPVARSVSGAAPRPATPPPPPPPPPPHRPVQPQDSHQAAAPVPPAPEEKRPRWRMNGWFWAILTVAISGGIGFTAVALLLKLPAVPNCPATFWPTASASMRLYCAQLAANKQTTKDLLEAIALVEVLPADHALRPEINRQVELWSLDILKIGEEQFQAGKLTEAVAVARKIPSHVPAFKLVQDQIDRWEGIWKQAEEIYQQGEQQLRQSNWNQAFREAVRLSAVRNNYWATTRYEELVDKIQLGREESGKLDQAYKLYKSNNVDNILQAIKLAEEISPSSYAYKEAQDLIADSSSQLIKIAQNRLDKRDWQGVMEIANKLPAKLKLDEMQADLTNLAQAISRAEEGTVSGLEVAIANAQSLTPARPLYDKAQQLLGRWQLEIQDVARLQKARDYAQTPTVNNLVAAIAEAQLVPSNNPRYSEANTQIKQWTNQVQTLEDRPILTRAEEVASFGGVASLEAAIQEASAIGSGRALYQEAQNKIGQWRRNAQRLQDQPYLDQASSLASAGNYPAAISSAQLIRPGRTLHSEAQGKISSWQAEIQGQQRLQEAYQSAASATPQALANAIRVARQVPNSSKSRASVPEVVNRWAYQILSMAQERSSTNVSDAIAIGKLIPSGTAAYPAAQSQIQAWQRSLEPIYLTPPPQPITELAEPVN